jgi:Zn-dependent peptidase ImmA (M78 family)/O-acetyl-ADP-ribose deacetylase (regulator of RNase III)
MRWTNLSVHKFAEGSHDPVEKMEEAARNVALAALDDGWTGPPFDPIKLAEILDYDVEAREDVVDARIRFQDDHRFKIEFNPTRPRARIFFSIAHEIAHTFFPDCKQRVRYRGERMPLASDDWQVEMLCNVGAAELLIPIGSVIALRDKRPTIEDLLALRKEFHVSTEAILIRFAKLSYSACAAFCSSRVESGSHAGGYRVDYLIPSRSWSAGARAGALLSEDSPVKQCVAIGFTAKGSERLFGEKSKIEAVGLPPYPGHVTPRVAGLIWQSGGEASGAPAIRYLRGNALEPRGSDQRIIAHIVNDQTSSWGGKSFAAAIRAKWPDVHRTFVQIVESGKRTHLALGATSQIRVSKDIQVFNIVAQHGLGSSAHPRIRYAALKQGLLELARVAKTEGASVHMPRIGTGNAGGDWNVIAEILDETLVRQGISPTVYELPSR